MISEIDSILTVSFPENKELEDEFDKNLLMATNPSLKIKNTLSINVSVLVFEEVLTGREPKLEKKKILLNKFKKKELQFGFESKLC